MDKLEMIIGLYSEKREVEKMNAECKTLIEEGQILARLGLTIVKDCDTETQNLILKRLKDIRESVDQITLSMKIMTDNVKTHLDKVTGELKDLN